MVAPVTWEVEARDQEREVSLSMKNVGLFVLWAPSPPCPVSGNPQTSCRKQRLSGEASEAEARSRTCFK